MQNYKTLKELYYEFLIPLQKKYRQIESRGLRVDFEQRKRLDDKYLSLLKENHENLNSLAGHEVNFNSNAGEKGQVPRLIYHELNCPRRAGVDDDTLTALKNNILSKNVKWERAIKIIDLVLECRKLHKCLNTYVRARPDLDGRMRTWYSLIKETGRSSTQILKPPNRWGKWGLAFQTITKHADKSESGIGRDLRSMFIPDDGKIFVEVDLSQAEARVVMLLAEDYDLLEKMDDPLFDLHVLTSSWIYPNIFSKYIIPSKPGYFERAAKKELMRQRGKKTRHAGHYDMGANECAIQMQISVAKAKNCLEVFHKYSPNVKEKFHKGVQNALLSNHNTLWKPPGRRREFYEKWGNKLFKEAYADIPQGSVSDQTKWSILRADEQGVTDVVMEAHDSITYQIEEEKLDWSLGIVQPLMESEIDFSCCSLPRGKLKIPSEVKVYRENLEKGEDYARRK